MINKISFLGKIYQADPRIKFSRRNEIEEIKTYADVYNCDIVLLSRNYYCNNKGKYNALLVKEDPSGGPNLYSTQTFDFQKAPDIMIQNVPNFSYII